MTARRVSLIGRRLRGRVAYSRHVRFLKHYCLARGKFNTDRVVLNLPTAIFRGMSENSGCKVTAMRSTRA